MAFAVSLALLLLLAGASVASAQDYRPNTISVGVSRVLLGSGDDPGAFHYARYTRRLLSRIGVSLSAGRVNSNDLTFDPENSFRYRYRKLNLGELALQIDPLRFKEGRRYEHRIGFNVGVSFRDRYEERPRELLSPTLLEDEIARAGLSGLLERRDADALRLFNDNGETYGLVTYIEDGREIGYVATLNYRVDTPRLALGFEAGYRSYSEGTPIFNYGFSLGYRF